MNKKIRNKEEETEKSVYVSASSFFKPPQECRGKEFSYFATDLGDICDLLHIPSSRRMRNVVIWERNPDKVKIITDKIVYNDGNGTPTSMQYILPFRLQVATEIIGALSRAQRNETTMTVMYDVKKLPFDIGTDLS